MAAMLTTTFQGQIPKDLCQTMLLESSKTNRWIWTASRVKRMIKRLSRTGCRKSQRRKVTFHRCIRRIRETIRKCRRGSRMKNRSDRSTLIRQPLKSKTTIRKHKNRPRLWLIKLCRPKEYWFFMRSTKRLSSSSKINWVGYKRVHPILLQRTSTNRPQISRWLKGSCSRGKV